MATKSAMHDEWILNNRPTELQLFFRLKSVAANAVRAGRLLPQPLTTKSILLPNIYNKLDFSFTNKETVRVLMTVSYGKWECPSYYVTHLADAIGDITEMFMFYEHTQQFAVLARAVLHSIEKHSPLMNNLEAAIVTLITTIDPQIARALTIFYCTLVRILCARALLPKNRRQRIVKLLHALDVDDAEMMLQLLHFHIVREGDIPTKIKKAPAPSTFPNVIAREENMFNALLTLEIGEDVNDW